MAGYSCVRCGYLSLVKRDMIRHIYHRQELCQPSLADVDKYVMIESFKKQMSEIQDHKTANKNLVLDGQTYICHFCDKGFFTRGGRSAHIRTHHPDVNRDFTSESHNTETHTNSHNNTTTTTNSHNVINIQNLNLHVDNRFIRSFGDENTSYITDAERKAVIEGGHEVICTLMKKIFFNEEHPENRNVKLVSLKQKTVKVKQPKDWAIKHIPDTVLQMYRKAANEGMKAATPEEMSANLKTTMNAMNANDPTRNQLNHAVGVATAELINSRTKE